ncbi:hypothetical protein [Methylobacterium sp. A52T]
MSDVSLKAIAIPRGWDGQRLRFALVFTFEIKPGKDGAAPVLGSTFPKWPSESKRLLPVGGPGLVRLAITPDRAATQTLAVSRLGPFDDAQATDAWTAIFGLTGSIRGQAASAPVSPLTTIFTGTQAPQNTTGASVRSDDRGRAVSVNPRGGADLRPTQRIESLELDAARRFVASANVYTAALRSASRHELAMAKAVAFRNSDALSRKFASEAAAKGMSPTALTQMTAASIDLEGSSAALVTALYFAQEAGSEGERLQRTINLGRNRPVGAVGAAQVTNPGTGEILARLKQHPGAMHVLGLVVDCAAPFDPGGAKFTTGKIAIDFGGPVADVTTYTVATRFELQADPHGLPYFRAAERDPGEIDDADRSWRRFHLLPPSRFSLQQSDHARTMMRARQDARSTSDAQRSAAIDEALTNAIIIQAERRVSAAGAIRTRLRQAQVMLNGTVGGQRPTPATEMLLHAEDLMSGVTFEVALGDANGIAGEWHSLCRRHLSVTAGAKSLFECVEEGFVSTSVTMSAPPLVGSVWSVTPAAPDPTNLDKLTLEIVEDWAYNTPAPPLERVSPAGYLVTAPRSMPRTNADLAALAAQNEPAAQPTQLRGVFRDVVTIRDLRANPAKGAGRPGVDGHDRVHLTIGPQVDVAQPTLVESLFISPLFATDALSDPDLPQTGLQVLRARNDLRDEHFPFAFDGSVTAFLDVDGRDFAPKAPSPTTGWLGESFKVFELEGERRAYALNPSDIAAARPLARLGAAARIAAVVSDSLPQAILTLDHAMMQTGKLTLLPLPFAPPRKSDRFTTLEAPVAEYPLRFRFRGVAISAAPTVGAAGSVDLRLTGFNDAPGSPALVCPPATIVDRAGHPSALDSSRPGWTPVAVSGDGVLVRPGDPFIVTQARVLGNGAGEAATARSDPFLAWVPRVLRIEQRLEPVRGPVTGRIGFDVAGKITAPVAQAIRFTLTSAPDAVGEAAYVTVSWPGIAAKNPPRLPMRVVLPVGLTAAAPADDLIVSARGRVEDVFLWPDGTRNAAPDTVLLVETWNVLASGSIADERLSDEARAAKASPRLDWIVTVATDDQGEIPVRIDSTLAPADTARLFHPLDLRLPTGSGQQPLWIDIVCVDQIGERRGVGWPGWIAAHAPRTTPGVARALTLLDMRSLPLKPLDGDAGGELTGYFKLAGPRGAVTWGGAAAFVESLALQKILGEVASIEVDASDCVLHLTGLSGAPPWQARLRCAPTRRFGDITPDLVSRRAIDLQPGDCVFASVRPDPKGWFEIVPAAADPDAGALPADAAGNEIIALAAGLFGRWSPAPISSPALTKAVLAFGSIDHLPGTVTTPGGVSRTVWAPHPVMDAPALRSPDRPPSGSGLDATVLRSLPVAFARTIIAHAAPQSIKGGPSPTPKAVHAVASDAFARWSGWWLTVPQPGASDVVGKDPSGGWPIRFKVRPTGHMLPLRVQRTYWIRGWRTDLAGNIGYDTLDARARAELDRLLKTDPFACAKKLDGFRRPDLPLAPLLAQPGKDFRRPEFSFVGCVQGLGEKNAADQPPGGSVHGLSLVLVTNSAGEALPAREAKAKEGMQELPPLFYASGHLLPPPTDVETALSKGGLDPDPAKVKSASALKAHGEWVEATIYKHEQFYDDGVFGRRPKTGLNYFPDPFATAAVLRLAETLPSALVRPGGAAGPVAPLGPWSAFARLSFFPHGDWPSGDVTPHLELAAGPVGVNAAGQNAIFRVPPGRVAEAQIVAVEPNAGTSAVAPGAGLTLSLIHAVTGPLRQPEWIDLAGDPARKAGDTAQTFTGHVAVDVPSTGSVGFSLFWTDPWDETVPALFGAAKARATVVKGAIAKVIVDAGGFGYGSEAAVRPLDTKTGKGAVLLPVVANGVLSAVTIEAAGAGYPDGEIDVVVARRPPLHTLATAAATVSKGKIVNVTLADDARDNGYYARPPRVRIHDMKGAGVGADCRAVVTDGRVTGFVVDQPGRGYSDNVIVGVYTDEAVIADQSVADRTRVDLATWVRWPFKFSQAFGDTRARPLYLVAQGRTRFRDEVDLASEEPMTTEPRRYELPSTARPPKPELAYLLPSFKPVKRLDGSPGHLIEQRDGMIRCYVHRPWNATGDEKLGVVIFAAQVNTTLVKEGSHREGIVPPSLRQHVSRWGFDPVWDDVATAPLTADDFVDAVDIVRYDDLAESAGSDWPPVGIALHDMRYMPRRDMWYADIAIRPPDQGMPFVRLALVRYQPNAVQGLTMSNVELADPIVLPSHRRLTIYRVGEGTRIEVRGNFDGLRRSTRKKQSLPSRRMVVELRQRTSGLPVDIEGPLAFGDRHGIASLDSWDLQRAEPSLFAGSIPLGSNVMKNAGGFYLAVKELEVFPTAASHRDRTGTAGTITADRPTFERLVFYRRLDLTDLPKG